MGDKLESKSSILAWCLHGLVENRAAMVTGLPQLFAVIFAASAQAVFIPDFAKITRSEHFFGCCWRLVALQCVVRQ
jgi:hypothetical protein